MNGVTTLLLFQTARTLQCCRLVSDYAVAVELHAALHAVTSHKHAHTQQWGVSHYCSAARGDITLTHTNEECHTSAALHAVISDSRTPIRGVTLLQRCTRWYQTHAQQWGVSHYCSAARGDITLTHTDEKCHTSGALPPSQFYEAARSMWWLDVWHRSLYPLNSYKASTVRKK